MRCFLSTVKFLVRVDILALAPPPFFFQLDDVIGGGCFPSGSVSALSCMMMTGGEVSVSPSDVTADACLSGGGSFDLSTSRAWYNTAKLACDRASGSGTSLAAMCNRKVKVCACVACGDADDDADDNLLLECAR